jgi:uncharacterized membrane protein YeaQ/YmgE (transglycosylase-associated protein family)
MDTMWLIIFIGAVTGWLAGNFMKNGGFGLPGNVLVGVVGGAAGCVLFRLIGHSSGGSIGAVAAAFVGAAALLSVITRFKNGKESTIYYQGDELWVRRKPLNKR